MKLIIEQKEYNVSEECLRDIFNVVKKVVVKADLPKEIINPIWEMTSFDNENLNFLAGRLRDSGLSFYHGLSTPVRLVAIQLARWIIARIEMRTGSAETRALLRPPRRKDPIEHLIDVFYPVIEKAILPEIEKIRDVSIEVTTQDNTVSSINFSQDISRREMDTNGDIREWQDYGG